MRLRDLLLLPVALVVSTVLMAPAWVLPTLALVVGVALLVSWLT